MAITLQKNSSISLEKAAGKKLKAVTLGLGWDPAKPNGLLKKIFGSAQNAIDLDASAIMIDDNNKSFDIVWFRQLSSLDGSISHSGDNLTGEGEGDDESIYINLLHLPEKTKHIVFTVNSFRGQTFDSVENAYVRILNPETGDEIAKLNLTGKGSHTGLVMGRMSRTADGWEFHAIGSATRAQTVQSLKTLAENSTS